MQQIVCVNISNCNSRCNQQNHIRDSQKIDDIEYGGRVKSECVEKEIYRELGYDYIGINEVSNWNKVRAIIIDGQSDYYYWWIFCVENAMEHKLICEIVESDVVDYRCTIKSLKLIKNAFTKILTWQDDIIDNCKYFKRYINIADDLTINYSKNSNERNYLFAMIAANKNSFLKGELYSERKMIISYFEEKNDKRFALFGVGWNDRNRCWNGTIKNKSEAYHNAKFGICLENARSNGYITEKIFDCFICGIVPIYGGAKNIEEYIPSNCYIDYFSFMDIGEMVSYAEKMDARVYEQYLSNIRKFLNTEEIKRFSLYSQIQSKIKLVESSNNNMNVTPLVKISMWVHLRVKGNLRRLQNKNIDKFVNVYHRLCINK